MAATGVGATGDQAARPLPFRVPAFPSDGRDVVATGTMAGGAAVPEGPTGRPVRPTRPATVLAVAKAGNDAVPGAVVDPGAPLPNAA